MADQLRKVLEKIRALRLNPYCMTPSPEQEMRRAWEAAQVNTIVCAALSAPPEQPELITGSCSDCPPARYPTDKTRCAECPQRTEVMPTDHVHTETVGPVTPPGVEQAGSGHTDDYVAWLRWVGDEEHRHLVVCDSDSPGAFKVYRRPND